MSYPWLLIVPSFKKSLIVEQFQRNYLNSIRSRNQWAYFIIEATNSCNKNLILQSLILLFYYKAVISNECVNKLIKKSSYTLIFQPISVSSQGFVINVIWFHGA